MEESPLGSPCAHGCERSCGASSGGAHTRQSLVDPLELVGQNTHWPTDFLGPALTWRISSWVVNSYPD